MKPLSVLPHLWGNRRRTIPVFAAVGLSVLLISMMQAIVSIPLNTAWRELVEPYRNTATFAAKTAPLDPDFVESLSGAGGVAAIYPCAGFYTNIDSVAGGMMGTQVLALGEGMVQVLSEMGLSLAEGRLPRPGSSEIVLHETVARNKGLRIGDDVGSDVQPGEVLEGKYTVCGILRGKAILSATSLVYEMERRSITYEYSLGALAVAQKGALLQMNEALGALDGSGLILRTLQSSEGQYRRDTASISVLVTAIGLMTMAIVSICAGFLSYIHFLQRRGEFAILNAIGYTEPQIIRRAFAEISLVNLGGLGAGLLLSALAGLLLNTFFFWPKGLAMAVFEAEPLLASLCVPLFTTLFSVIPVWRMVRELDAVKVLEGQP